MKLKTSFFYTWKIDQECLYVCILNMEDTAEEFKKKSISGVQILIRSDTSKCVTADKCLLLLNHPWKGTFNIDE